MAGGATFDSINIKNMRIDPNEFLARVAAFGVAKYTKLSIAQASAILRISPVFLRKHCKRGIFASATKNRWSKKWEIRAWEIILLRCYFDHFQKLSVPRWFKFFDQNLHASMPNKKFIKNFVF
jgi:hypothetical protein